MGLKAAENFRPTSLTHFSLKKISELAKLLPIVIVFEIFRGCEDSFWYVSHEGSLDLQLLVS